MRTTLRILDSDGSYFETLKEYAQIPNKGDYIVFKHVSYSVMYTEFNYDTEEVFIVVSNKNK